MISPPGSLQSKQLRRSDSPAAQREAWVFTGILSAGLTLATVATVRAGWIDQMLLVPMLLGALVVLIGGSVLVIRALPRLHRTPNANGEPHRRYGTANQVTHLRLAMSAMLAGHALATGSTAWLNSSTTPQGNLAFFHWTLLGFVMLAAALDAVDGLLARRQGLTSELGARFDMEVDAFFILMLSLTLWQSGKIGAWILLAGAMRYLFVAAAWHWHWLSAPLPPSRRRQAICVLQVLSLIIGLVPGILPPWPTVFGALGLALLTWSFAVDIRWLASANTLQCQTDITR